MCESTSLFIGEKNPLKSYLIKNASRKDAQNALFVLNG